MLGELHFGLHPVMIFSLGRQMELVRTKWRRPLGLSWDCERWNDALGWRAGVLEHASVVLLYRSPAINAAGKWVRA